MTQQLVYHVRIYASLSSVWKLLTDPESMKIWLNESKLDVISDFKVGSQLIVKGDLHGHDFINKGKIIRFDKESVFEYDYLSNISLLPDHVRNYTKIKFELSQREDCVEVKLTAENFPTIEIFKHIEFYWRPTLFEIKKLAELT